MVKNTNVNSAWKLKDDENDAQVFGRRTSPIPKFEGKPICARYQIAGRCNLGTKCQRKASHCVLTGDTKGAMTAWVQECREAVAIEIRTGEYNLPIVRLGRTTLTINQ